MRHQVLFIQGGGEGAYQADQLLVASLSRTLGPGYEMLYPQVADEDNPDYRNWKSMIGKELRRMKSGAILVGHSLGASFLLKYLTEEKIDIAVAGIFLIATPYWGGDGWRYEGYEAITLPEDFPAKLPRDTPIFLYHSRDDETVPFAHLALYARNLPQASIHGLARRGHQLNNDTSEVAEDIRGL